MPYPLFNEDGLQMFGADGKPYYGEADDPCCCGDTPTIVSFCDCCFSSAMSMTITLPTLSATADYGPTAWQTDGVNAHNAIVSADFIRTVFTASEVTWEAYSDEWYDGGIGAPFQWHFIVRYSCSGEPDYIMLAEFSAILTEGGVDIAIGYNVEVTYDCCGFEWIGTDIVFGASNPSPPYWTVAAAGSPMTITNNKTCKCAGGDCVPTSDNSDATCTDGVNTCTGAQDDGCPP